MIFLTVWRSQMQNKLSQIAGLYLYHWPALKVQVGISQPTIWLAPELSRQPGSLVSTLLGALDPDLAGQNAYVILPFPTPT